jgi:CDGSH-type Zn-finger protein
MSRITITVRNNASLAITGDDVALVRLVDHEGNEISTEGKKVISLCRCGASTKKPFCDGTHSKIGFKGAEQARIEFDAQQQQQQQVAQPQQPAPTPTPAPVTLPSD